MGKEEEKKNYKDYDDRFSTYMWNKETGEVFGRTGFRWVQLTVFYFIFYCGLAAFAGTCYYLFSLTLTPERPKWILAESLIGTNPGMGYRPMPDADTNAESTLIWYRHSNKDDAAFWYKQLEEYISVVDNPTDASHHSKSKVNCGYNGTHATKHQFCHVDTSQFGTACSKGNNFGYTKGEPCILLKLNRIFGWEPEGFGIRDGKYDAELLRDELAEKGEEGMPDDLRKYIVRELTTKHQNHKEEFLNTIWISCAGENVGDKENVGTNIKYFPEGQRGIPGYFFPYYQQKGYESPFIFVQFANPLKGVLINIECKAWARNIIHDKVNRLGSVHFELMID